MAISHTLNLSDDTGDESTQISSEIISDNDIEENATNDVKSSPLKRYMNSQKRGYESGSDNESQGGVFLTKRLDLSKSGKMEGKGKQRETMIDLESQIRNKTNESHKKTNDDLRELDAENTRLDTWSNKNAPETFDDLCIHKRKLMDLEKEIRSLIYKNDENRILVVSGPTGSGKSTACKIIADRIMKEKIKWKHQQFIGSSISDSLNNGNDKGYTVEFNISKNSNRGNSSVSQFNEFLEQCKLLTGLNEKCLIIEELPNIFHKDTHNNFQRSIRDWLDMRDDYELPPMIICVTEFDIENDLDWSNNTNFTIDNTVKVETVFGFNLMQKIDRGWKRIKFNAVAKTFLKKALLRVAKLENVDRNKTVNFKIESLSTLGDLRNAINTFEFWYRFQYTKGQNESLQTLEGKESGLDIFHSIGKIIYGTKHQDEEFEDFCKRHTMKLRFDQVSPNVVTADNVSSEVSSHLTRFNLCCLENYSVINPIICEELCSMMDVLSISDTIIGRCKRFGVNDANILKNNSFYSCYGLRSICSKLSSMGKNESNESNGGNKKVIFSRDSKLRKKLQKISNDIKEFQIRREQRLMRVGNYRHINAIECVLIDGYYQTQILASFKFRMQMFKKYGDGDILGKIERLGGKISVGSIKAGDDLGFEVEDEVTDSHKMMNKDDLQRMEETYFGVRHGNYDIAVDSGGEIDSDPIEDSDGEMREEDEFSDDSLVLKALFP